jgi:O-antigen/teichoic acid export membrane protein
VSAPEAADAPRVVGARRAAADIAVQLVGMTANLALGVGVAVVMARHLGDRAYGQWSTIFAVLWFLTFFTDLGLRDIVIREVAAAPRREAQWLAAALSLLLALAVPTTIVAAAILAVVARGHDMLLAGLVLSGLVLASPVGSLSVVFQLHTRNDISTAITTLKSVLWAAAVVALAVAGKGLVAFALCFLATSLIADAVTTTFALRRVRIRLGAGRELWRPLLRTAIPVAIAAFLSLAYGRIDQVLVFLLAGSRDAGLYGAVYRILDTIQFIPAAVMTTLTPLLAGALARDRARLRAILEQAATYLCVASFGALAVTLAAARPIVKLLFGHEFAAAAPALPVLMGVFVVVCFGYLIGSMIVLTGLQRRNVVLALAALVLNLGLNFALIPPYGFQAAAWVTLATEILWAVLAGRLVLREVGIGLDLRRLPRVVVAAAVTGGAVAVARAAGSGVVGLLAIGAVLYPALILGLRIVTTGEIRRLVRGEAG